MLFLDIDRPMRWPGRVAAKTLIKLLEQTAYVKDARNNISQWQEQLQSLVGQDERREHEAKG